MALDLAAMRAKIKEQEEKKAKGNTGFAQTDTSFFAHFNANDGSTTTVRFLPDRDETNEWPWIEKLTITLPFNGVIGGDLTKRIFVKVPCVEMYHPGEKICPILNRIRAEKWFDNEDTKKLGSAYWAKKSYIMQGFVVGTDSTVTIDKELPENTIRRMLISPEIKDCVMAGLKDIDIEESPFDYMRGRDFRIIKEKASSGYSSYKTSKFAGKERALTLDEIDAIEKYGLFNLRDFLPKEPSAEALAVLPEMLEASLNGEPYDPKWKAYFSYGGGNDSHDGEATAQAQKNTVSTPVVTPSAKEPVKETKAVDAKALLASVRAKAQQQNQ